MQKMSSDKAMVVKGTMISPATWRNLTGVEAKEKGNGKDGRANARKSGLGEEHGRATIGKYSKAQNQEAMFKKIPRMEHKSIQLYHYINGRATIGKYMISMVRNQEAIFKKIPRMEHKSTSCTITSMGKTKPFERLFQG
ncbi:hypothetical protein V6N12_065726 [Hibiscus sabdariffa]|uniref:Uncharacterized protein n=1 Tax=Hibiscus sabdariffa TaxID=183260 RepID=A0ABR2G9R8_9ROSI